MKTLRTVLSTLFAILALAVAARAADADPSGRWQWFNQGPQGPLEINARYDVKDGVLTGANIVHGGASPTVDGSFKDGIITYFIVREVEGEKLRVKFSGKLEGDAINGTIDRPMPGSSERQIVEWHAKRVH